MGFSLSLPSQEIPTKMGFFTPSLLNHLRLNAFKRPLLSTLLCSLSLSLLLYISQFVVVNFLGHCDFLGFCSCRSFGVCLISIPLCYTQFRNIWKLQIVKNLILWKAMTTQPGFEHSRIFQLPQLVTLPQGLKGSANTWRYCRSGFPI